MKEIVIKGIVDGELTSEEYDELFDVLMQFGITEIKIEES